MFLRWHMNMWTCVCACVYLLIATVRASGELAQGHMTSGFKPLVWKTLRKASQDEIDPERHNLKSQCFFFTCITAEGFCTTSTCFWDLKKSICCLTGTNA